MKRIIYVLLGFVGLTALTVSFNFADLNLAQVAQSTDTSTASDMNSTINWLLILVSVLIGAIIFLIFDITNLTSRVTGKQIMDWNKISPWMLLLFMILGLAGAFWEFFYHGKYVITEEATAHASEMNTMFNATLFFTGVVFVIVQFVLFYFTFKYRTQPGKKAVYYAHNNRLEIVWTAIPFVTMAVLVLMGMRTWSNITKPADSPPEQIEVFAYQFGWNARYPGEDKKFGAASFNYISGTNPLGLPVEREIETLVNDLKAELEDLYVKVKPEVFEANYEALKQEMEEFGLTYTDKKREGLEAKIERIESGEAMEDLKAAIYRKEKQILRIDQIKSASNAQEAVFNGSVYDDVISSEIHLVQGQEVELLFRARDVIHSAWIPHFKVQMNVVPGMQTKFRFTPVKTTAEARAERGDDSYDYYMICNKVCGSAHYNMKIKVVVETQEEYDAWYQQQNPAFAKNVEVETPVEETEILSDSTQTENQDLALN